MGHYTQHIVIITKEPTPERYEALLKAIQDLWWYGFQVNGDHIDDACMNGGSGNSNGPLESEWGEVSEAVPDIPFKVHCVSEQGAIYDYTCEGGDIDENTIRETPAWYKHYEDPANRAPGANQNYYKDYGPGPDYPYTYGKDGHIPAGVEWWLLPPMFLNKVELNN